MTTTKCEIEGCGKKHYGKGWCHTHYARWWRHGDPTKILTGRGTDNITYFSAHSRVRRQRGPAKYQLCKHCGASAEQWAYNHDSEKERTESMLDRGKKPAIVAYSPDPEDYLPLCTSCHTKFDQGITSA